MNKGTILVLLMMANNALAQRVYLTVKAGNYSRNQTVVTAVLNKPLAKDKYYQILNEKTGGRSPVQLLNPTTVLFVLPRLMQAGEEITFRLQQGRSPSLLAPIVVDKFDKGLLIKVGGKPAFFYNTAVMMPPDTLPSFYARSGFIHPVLSPAGSVLTDDFPAGHAHQHGVMTAWVNTLFKGQPLDFWNQQQKTGSARHVEVESIENGEVATVIHLHLQQYSLAEGTVLEERWVLTIYPFTQGFLYDLKTTQKNVTRDTLYLKKYHYGSMAFRGSREWNDADSAHFKTRWNILTDSGYGLVNADGKRAAYVSASGLIDGKPAGVAVFGFPSNYQYPQALRVHPQMPYWGFVPAATGAFTIDPGAVYSSQYRFYAFDGSPDQAVFSRLNNDIVHPPEVTVRYTSK